MFSVAGIIPVPDGYLKRLKEHCEKRGMLLILDEAQTALGRLGTMIAFEQHDVVPDLLTLSMTLGAGLPLSATVTTDATEARGPLEGLLHVTSHVSDPLPAAVGRAVLQTGGGYAGAGLRDGLQQLQRHHKRIADVRGTGILLVVNLVSDRDARTSTSGISAVGSSMRSTRRPTIGPQASGLIATFMAALPSVSGA